MRHVALCALKVSREEAIETAVVHMHAASSGAYESLLNFCAAHTPFVVHRQACIKKTQRTRHTPKSRGGSMWSLLSIWLSSLALLSAERLCKEEERDEGACWGRTYVQERRES